METVNFPVCRFLLPDAFGRDKVFEVVKKELTTAADFIIIYRIVLSREY